MSKSEEKDLITEISKLNNRIEQLEEKNRRLDIAARYWHKKSNIPESDMLTEEGQIILENIRMIEFTNKIAKLANKISEEFDEYQARYPWIASTKRKENI